MRERYYKEAITVAHTIIPALGRLRQDCKFQASSDYITRPYLKSQGLGQGVYSVDRALATTWAKSQVQFPLKAS